MCVERDEVDHDNVPAEANGKKRRVSTAPNTMQRALRQNMQEKGQEPRGWDMYLGPKNEMRAGEEACVWIHKIGRSHRL